MASETASNAARRTPGTGAATPGAVAIALALAAALPACRGDREPASPSAGGGEAADSDRPASCPATAEADDRLPRVEPRHARASYWLERLAEDHDIGEVLLSPSDIRNLNASMQVPREHFHGQADLLAEVDRDEIASKLEERLTWLRDKFESGDYVRRDGDAIDDPPGVPSPIPPIEPAVRVALGEVPFFCAPTTAGYFTPELDLRLDRNRCSTAHAQEPVQVLAEWSGDLLLARTRYTWGWIRAGAPLSPPIAADQAERFVRGPHATLARAWSPGVAGAPDEVPGGTRVPVASGGDALAIAGAGGVVTAPAPGGARPTERPLTRRAVVEEAFRHLGASYGFGGANGGRDCSRLMLDVFESFGLRLPRHSGWQARAGSFSIDVSDLDEAARLRLLDEASRKGVVLAHFPGHIMLYLGRDDRGTPMALHSFAEYMRPCDDYDGETLVEVDRVQVSDLELGRGSSRGAFIERFTRFTVLGQPPGVELAGVAETRPPAPVAKPPRSACRGGAAERMLVSPARPGAGEPLRLVGAASRDPGPVELAIFGPKGREVPEPVRLGGPPHGMIATLDAPGTGRYTAVLGDGERVVACERFTVRERPGTVDRGGAGGPIWPVRRGWSPALEDLYAMFVERLFDYPIEDDLTWPHFHALLRDREHNILFGYLGKNEEEALELVPDCADLPYTLRAYFAWKLGLPFGYRSCSRARPGRPPRCERSGDNLMSRAEFGRRGDVPAFESFVDRGVRNKVHSSSGRTTPGDEDTDFYPVPLTRESLRPGALFTDPYGHLLVVADWIPQVGDRYGVLVGADAQPDGTVGRRRFWRGSFIFRPGTDSGGAGFKAFRPWRVGDDGDLVQPRNRALRARERAPFSLEQYEGSVDDFYDSMNALINPRPLDPEAVMVSLVDALEEAVSRRVTSVKNGEAFMRERGFRPIEMPHGSSIFLTTGAWENYSTPSRDWRLLISMDTVLELPEAVRRSPAQYGVAEDEVDAVVAELESALSAELAERELSYTRSDGSEWQLTLKDVTDRIERFEMAWNPNDCIEIRWAAPEGSDERSTCDRRAPAAQRERMKEYRPWFSERRRPAR